MAQRNNLLFFTFLFCVSINAFNFVVEPNKEECFYEQIDPGVTVGVMFQVTFGGRNDIDVYIKGPDDRLIYGRRRETEGKYVFQTTLGGTYSFCFSNQMSTYTQKSVSLDIDIGLAKEKQQQQKGVAGEQEVAKPEHLTPLETSVQQLHDALVTIQNEQKYLKMREIRHRYTTESTNQRVIVWNAFEALTLVAMSLFQIYYLRRFFEDRRSI
jgi:hypothetical protein